MDTYFNILFDDETNIFPDHGKLTEYIINNKINGGSNIKVIISPSSIFSKTLIQYMTNKKLEFTSSFDIVKKSVENVYENIENKFYSYSDIRNLVTDEFIKLIDANTSILLLSVERIINVEKILNHLSNATIFNINASFECMFDSYINMYNKQKYKISIHNFLFYITSLYESVDDSNDSTIDITKDDLKILLQKCKYCFDSDETINNTINRFFKFYDEESNTLHLKSRITNYTHNISIKSIDDISKELDAHFT